LYISSVNLKPTVMANKELSEKEYADRKEKLHTFYTNEIKYLSNQLKYEELLRDVSKARAERLQADAYVVQMTKSDEEGNDASK